MSHNLSLIRSHCFSFFFFFNDTATTEIYTLSLHDALPISPTEPHNPTPPPPCRSRSHNSGSTAPDRKSTRLNSSHSSISYAVFCLKKKKKKNLNIINKKSKPQHTHPYHKHLITHSTCPIYQ